MFIFCPRRISILHSYLAVLIYKASDRSARTRYVDCLLFSLMMSSNYCRSTAPLTVLPTTDYESDAAATSPQLQACVRVPVVCPQQPRFR